jgi:hypothetical protein
VNPTRDDRAEPLPRRRLRSLAAIAAKTNNAYKQVLEAGAKPEDLVVIDFNQEGTAMLEDGIFVTVG